MDRGEFGFRGIAILILCGLWGLAALFCLFHYTVTSRARYLDDCRGIAWREGTIPVLRAKLLDRTGQRLAWTDLRYELLLERKPSNRRREAALRRFLHGFGWNLPSSLFVPMTVERSLSAETAERLLDGEKEYPELRVRMIPERRTLFGSSALQTKIAEWEKQYDAELAGTPGKFKVMLDRHGVWFAGTLRILEQPRAGHDVRIADFPPSEEKRHE